MAETTETTSVEAKETFPVEPTKETTPAVQPEVAAVEESSSADAGEAAVVAPEKVENAATENAEAKVEAVAVAAPEKVEVAVEAEKKAEAEPVKAEAEPVKAEAEPVKEESKQEEKEAVVTV